MHVSSAIPPAQTAAADDVLLRLPLSQRAVAAGSPHPPRHVALAPVLPALPPEVTDAVAREWGVVIGRDDAGADPRGIPAFATLFAQARTEQVLRAISARTNLVLAGTRTAVVGDGALAAAIVASLTRIGSRVTVVAADPHARLRSHVTGLTTAAPDALDDVVARLDHVVATGEGHAPLDPAHLPAIVADASPDGSGLAPAAGESVRPHVRRVAAGGGWIVGMPQPYPADIDAASALEWHSIDLVVAVAVLTTIHDGESRDAVSARLAEVVVS